MKKIKHFVGLKPQTTITMPEVKSQPQPVSEKDDGYLARQAGLQTVQTSMRGILKTNENAPKRKKLLGE